MKKNIFTDEQIEDFLFNNIKRSIENDVGIAIRAYLKDFIDDNSGEGKGFFAVPRMIFPEIDGLGSYITGEPRSTGLNIKTYLQSVMYEIDSNYRKYATFIALIYRNGLLHQHSPKNFKFKNQNLGWMFQLSTDHGSRKHHLTFLNNRILMIDMRIFYQDTLDSIGTAYNIIIGNKENFVKSYREQTKSLSRNYLLTKGKKQKSQRYIYPRDFNFLKELKT